MGRPSYHGNALRVAVQVGRGAAAAARRLAASAAGVLQGSNQGLVGDGTKLVAEGSIENENVDDKDPLADGGQVLQEEALVDKEGAACSGVKARSEESGLARGMPGAQARKSRPVPTPGTESGQDAVLLPGGEGRF